MTSPTPPGWYPDPGGVAPLRWWDGQAWTAAISAGVPAAPVATSFPVGAPAVPQQPQPSAGFAPSVPSQPQPQPFGHQPIGYQPMSAPMSSPTQKTIWQASSHATLAFIVTAVYLVIALTTPFGLVGIVPIIASVRSMQAGEKLAPYAVGAAALAFLVGMLKLTNHL